jgi:hypothetical protein
MVNSVGSPTLVNVLFFNNAAMDGGGIAQWWGTSPFIFINVTFSGNSASSSGGGIMISGGAATLTNSILWDNSAPNGSEIYHSGGTLVVSYSDIRGGWPGTANIDADPLFVDSANGDFRLQSDSPAIDGGDNNALPPNVATDLAGNPRIDYIVDMGAYENPAGPGPRSFRKISPLNGSNNFQPALTISWNPSPQANTYAYCYDTINNNVCDTEWITTTQTSAYLDNLSHGTTYFWQVRAANNHGAKEADNGDWWSFTTISVLYAAPTAQGSGNCSSWADACTLQTALAQAVSGNEVWVKAGVHYPGAAGNREATFALKNNVAIYGGFAGNETRREQRDWQANPTILSGDIDQNDINTDGNYIAETWNDIQGSNAYHVVTGSGTDNTAKLDGFIITAGQANGSGFYTKFGGGMYNSSGSPVLTNIAFCGNLAGLAGYDTGGGGMYNDHSSPSLTNVTFSGNQGIPSAGGMYNYHYSSPTLTDVTFSGNQAVGGGGGMYNRDHSNPTLTDVTFSGNSALSGGGMINSSSSSPLLTNIVFNSNQASNDGGGMKNNDSSNPTLTNVTFSGNSATNGGGMYNYSSSSPLLTNIVFNSNQASNYGGGMYNDSSNPTLTNVTFSGNQAGSIGGGLYNRYSNPTLVNAILWGDSASFAPEIYNYVSQPNITYSDVQGGWSGTGNINMDPLFVNQAGGDLRLRLGSPAIDAGNNGAVPPDVTTDLNGLPRFTDIPAAPDTGNGTPPIVDMGAYEAIPVLYAKSTASGAAHCYDWANACNLQTALSLATSGIEIWVAQGVHYPGAAGNREATFTLKNGVALYGGFAGNETSRDQRDPQANPTILSGDIDQNDVNTDGNFIAETWNDIQGENAYHVVTGNWADNTAVLDGFIITAGQANGSYPHSYGGGMYNNWSIPRLSNITFSGNLAAEWGGGMYNHFSSPMLTDVTFSGNKGSHGGGMYNDSSLTMTNFTFNGNSAQYGGGMYNTGNLMLTNVAFNGNSAQHGGGMYTYGKLTLTNVTFNGNNAIGADGPVGADGGGYGGPGENGYGGGLYNASGTLTITSGVFENNTARGGRGGAGDDSKATYCYWLFGWHCTYGHPAGNGGNGGKGYGGAIYNASGYLTVTASLLQNNRVYGGQGGNGGAGSPSYGGSDWYYSGFPGGSGGNGGLGYGGSIYNGSAAHLSLIANIFSQDGVTGGRGGNAGSNVGTGTGGGGNGGTAYGGALYNDSGNAEAINVALYASYVGGGPPGYGNPSGSYGYGYGGGIYNSGTMLVVNSTVARNYTPNSGGGGGSSNSGTLTFKNSIVAQNSPGNCLGGATSGGYNLEDGNTCGFTQPGDLSNTDPLFVAPASGNLRLQLTSPAIDAGNNAAVPSGVTTDLDGNPRIFGVAVDMGAYESMSYRLSVDLTGAGAGWVHSAPEGITCPGDCYHRYPVSTTVLLTATPGATSAVASWTGCDDAAGNTCTLTMTSNRNVTVTFSHTPGVLYAAPTAQGKGDCSSWADACALQTALANACSGDEIWVQAGVHYPGAAGERTATFTLKNSVAIYGGFAGTETARNQRDWQTNITVLSGDIDRNDLTDPHGVVTTTANIVGENAYHVVTGGGTDSTAVLDGFFITAGQANDPSWTWPHYVGGGMYNNSSSPTLTDVTFSGNYCLRRRRDVQRFQQPDADGCHLQRQLRHLRRRDVQRLEQPDADGCHLQRQLRHLRRRDVQLPKQPDADKCHLQQQLGLRRRRRDVQLVQQPDADGMSPSAATLPPTAAGCTTCTTATRR